MCANNEIPEDDETKVVTSVHILAEMQTPSQVVQLELQPVESEPLAGRLEKGQSIQKIVQFDLKEEGNHILAVSVSYTETLMADGSHAASGRVRSFRKLYQFVAQPCLSVRTKASELPPLEVENKALGPYGKSRLLRYALEAQLENVGDGPVVIEVRMFSFPDQVSPLTMSENAAQREASFQAAVSQLGLGETGLSRDGKANVESSRRSSGCIPSRAGAGPERGSRSPSARPQTDRTRNPGSTLHRMARPHG